MRLNNQTADEVRATVKPADAVRRLLGFLLWMESSVLPLLTALFWC